MLERRSARHGHGGRRRELDRRAADRGEARGEVSHGVAAAHGPRRDLVAAGAPQGGGGAAHRRDGARRERMSRRAVAVRGVSKAGHERGGAVGVGQVLRGEPGADGVAEEHRGVGDARAETPRAAAAVIDEGYRTVRRPADDANETRERRRPDGGRAFRLND
eukprot:29080-Pelagococcus_subviridis.AAC.8